MQCSVPGAHEMPFTNLPLVLDTPDGKAWVDQVDPPPVETKMPVACLSPMATQKLVLGQSTRAMACWPEGGEPEDHKAAAPAVGSELVTTAVEEKLVPLPTATQEVVLGHDTPFSAPMPVGVGSATQLWPPLAEKMIALEDSEVPRFTYAPTATQSVPVLAATHDTARMPPTPVGGVASDQMAPPSVE